MGNVGCVRDRGLTGIESAEVRVLTFVHEPLSTHRVVPLLSPV
jgi:hypothetical protein